MPTFQEFQARQQAKAHAPDRRAVLQDERRAQAHVSLRMGDLMGSDDWTVFRKHLQVIRESYAGMMAAAETSILGEALGEALLKLKLEHREASGVCRGIDLALMLPEQLQHQAATIEERLAGQLDTPKET